MVTAVLCGLAGVVLMVSVWLSVLRTVVIPRQSSSRVARFAGRAVVGTGSSLAARLPRRAGDTVLEFVAPVVLFATGVVWLVLLLAGLALFAFALDGARSPFTWHGPVAAAVVLAAISVPLVFVSFGVHLVRLTEAYSRRERLVNGLAARASTPLDADQLLADHLRGGSRDNLDAVFRTWLDWIADVHATHVGYPVLVHYRSARRLAWFQAAVIVMDAAALVTALAPTWAPPHARVLLDGGSSCLRDLAERVGVRLPVGLNTVSLHGREERAFGDTLLMAVRAGLPEERDRGEAWRIFQAERTRYAPYAAQLGARLLYDRTNVTWLSNECADRDPRRIARGDSDGNVE